MLDLDIRRRKTQCILGQESPTPKACRTTSFGTPNSFIAATIFALQLAIKRGGAIGAAKGLSDSRGAFSVTITAAGISYSKAALTSAVLDGVPASWLANSSGVLGGVIFTFYSI